MKRLFDVQNKVQCSKQDFGQNPRIFLLKGAVCENINKQACFLNTELLVLDIACKDLRNELRSKYMKRCRHKSSQTAVF